MEALSKLGINLPSILFYIVNFGIVVALLYYILYEPLLKMIEERRNTILHNLSQSEKLREEMVKLKEAQDEERKSIISEMKKEMKTFKDDVEKEKKQILADAQEQKTKMLEDAKVQIESEKEKLLSNVQNDLLSKVGEMVKYIVSSKIPEETVSKSVTEAWEKYK